MQAARKAQEDDSLAAQRQALEQASEQGLLQVRQELALAQVKLAGLCNAPQLTGLRHLHVINRQNFVMTKCLNIARGKQSCLPRLGMLASDEHNSNMWLTARPAQGPGRCCSQGTSTCSVQRWQNARRNSIIMLRATTEAKQRVHTRSVAAACVYPH